MVSVVMATYNSNKYIISQLNSIKEQDSDIDEVIIVDDCSTDNTIDIIEGYIKQNNLKKWIVYKNKKNLGFIKTFSHALEKAKGDIIILCDHDDIWLPNKVTVIKNIFNENPKILSLATSFIPIDEFGNRILYKKRLFYSNNNLIRKKVSKGKLNKIKLKDVVIYNISPGCTCALKREIRDLYLNNNHLLPHDWKINVIAACKNGLYYLDIPTTKYRIHEKNTIGLMHQSNYKKRKEIVINNLIEKKEILNIINKYCPYNKKDIKYMKSIVKTFENRVILLDSKKIIQKGFFILITSLSKGRLYESIVMDIISIIKSYIKG